MAAKKPTMAQAYKAAKKSTNKKASSSEPEPPLDFNPMYFDADAMFNQKGMKRLPSQGRVDDKTVHIRKGKMTSRDGKYDVKVSTVETPYSELSNTRAGKQSIYESSATKRKTPTKKKGK